MSRTITIDPITRLEGHGKIAIFLDDDGDVQQALFQVPELRGFEAFAVGRPAEEMPQITSRICGVCPTAHHMASVKALDALWGVQPTPAARTIRDLFYSLFYVEDHTLHFYFLGGPDFVVGPGAPAAQRNVLGVIETVGTEIGLQVIGMRKRIRDVMEFMGGKTVHPVLGLPGGVAKAFPEDKRDEVRQLGKDAVAFAQFSLKVFHDVVLGNEDYVKVITGGAYEHATHYMGLVDDNNKVNMYDGNVRVVRPDGSEHSRFPIRDYAEMIGEHVEPWTYIKFPFLRNPGWKGFVDGAESGIYRVAPLARLNASDGMATPLAQAEYETMYSVLGGSPSHHTLANHWARLIELLYAAEHVVELAEAPELTSKEIRNMDLGVPNVGVGVVEAPRGTLIHHYESDERGVLTACNLIVATVGNSAAMCMSIEKAAKALIKGGQVNDGLLNMVEMAFRAYDPCLSCATHALPGQMPLTVEIIDPQGDVRQRIVRS